MNNTFVLLIATASAFLLNLIITPVLISVSHRKGWYDSIDHRKIHSGSIPRLGGIGIFLSFLIVIIIIFIVDQFLIPMPLINFIILLSVLLASNLIGLIDDFTNLRPRYKLFIQIAISLFLVIFGFKFSSISVPFMKNSISLPAFVSYPLTFLWILGLTNAINLIDGVDGLAGGVTLISLIGFSVIFFFLNIPPITHMFSDQDYIRKLPFQKHYIQYLFQVVAVFFHYFPEKRLYPKTLYKNY